jgi:dTDP-4-dehydrorhamnose reductase
MKYFDMDNENRNIIVLGANGMLGYVVASYLEQFYDVTKLTSNEFNILNDPISKLNELVKANTTTFINCAGVIKPRVDKMSPVDVIKINSQFPIRLSKQLDGDVDIIHVSTDCVFSGNKGGSYTEYDDPDATDLYGISKAVGEYCYNDALVIRTSIIGEELNNKYSLLEWAISQKDKEVNGWTDHIWSGVTTLQLAKYIQTLIEKESIFTELVQYVSEHVNKYELLNMISLAYDLDLKINETTSGKPCDRSMTYHSEEYLAPDLYTQLKELREFFNGRR